MMGRPTPRMQMRYSSTNAPPSFSHVMNGNFHKLPSPMALPVAARMKPTLEPQCSRGWLIGYAPLSEGGRRKTAGLV